MTVYPFTGAERGGRRNVKRACALLKVSSAAFCQHQAGPSQREREDAGLTEQIQAVHEQPKGRYGAPRICAGLRRRGHRHGRKRIARLRPLQLRRPPLLKLLPAPGKRGVYLSGQTNSAKLWASDHVWSPIHGRD